jgi:hypothetical protein
MGKYVIVLILSQLVPGSKMACDTEGESNAEKSIVPIQQSKSEKWSH